MHALCYVYHTAICGEPSPEAWQRYCQWAQLLWAGNPQELIKEMLLWQTQFEKPTDADNERSPRQLVADAILDLTNQQERMRYAEYRQQGLPITSAYIESTIQQINRRVKGTEKFWSINADPILQLRADAVSETMEIEKFLKTRPETLSAFTYYKMAG